MDDSETTGYVVLTGGAFELFKLYGPPGHLEKLYEIVLKGWELDSGIAFNLPFLSIVGLEAIYIQFVFTMQM